MSELLGDCRRVQRLRRPPRQPRRHALGSVARAAREVAGVQAADGLEFPVGVLVGKRFNYDFNAWTYKFGVRSGVRFEETPTLLRAFSGLAKGYADLLAMDRSTGLAQGPG